MGEEKTGKLKWVSDVTLSVAEADRVVYCTDRHTGQLSWRAMEQKLPSRKPVRYRSVWHC